MCSGALCNWMSGNRRCPPRPHRHAYTAVIAFTWAVNKMRNIRRGLSHARLDRPLLEWSQGGACDAHEEIDLFCLCATSCG